MTPPPCCCCFFLTSVVALRRRLLLRSRGLGSRLRRRREVNCARQFRFALRQTQAGGVVTIDTRGQTFISRGPRLIVTRKQKEFISEALTGFLLFGCSACSLQLKRLRTRSFYSGEPGHQRWFPPPPQRAKSKYWCQWEKRWNHSCFVLSNVIKHDVL